MIKEGQGRSFLKKGGKWGAIIATTWVAINIALPLIILRIPAVQKQLVALAEKIPFNIPGVG